MNNATMPADPSILNPIEDGPCNACHLADVKCIQQLTLYFCKLCNTAASMDNNALCFKYYLKFTQDVGIVAKGDGNPCNLTAFLETADLQTLRAAQINAELSLVP